MREHKGSAGPATTVRTIPPAAHLPRWPAALIAVALLALAALVVYLVATRATESSLSVPLVQRGVPSATAGTPGTQPGPGGTATVPSTAASGTPGATASPGTTPATGLTPSPATQLTPYHSTAGHYTTGYPSGWSVTPQSTLLGEQGARFAPSSGPADTSAGIYWISTGVFTGQQILDNAATWIGVPALDLTPVTSRQNVLLGGVACQRQVFLIPAGLSGYPVDTDVLFVGCSSPTSSWDLKFFAPASQFAGADAASFEPMLQSVQFGG